MLQLSDHWMTRLKRGFHQHIVHAFNTQWQLFVLYFIWNQNKKTEYTHLYYTKHHSPTKCNFYLRLCLPALHRSFAYVVKNLKTTNPIPPHPSPSCRKIEFSERPICDEDTETLWLEKRTCQSPLLSQVNAVGLLGFVCPMRNVQINHFMRFAPFKALYASSSCL